MLSTVSRGSVVPFPAFTGERIYMEPFFQQQGLPDRYKRWQATVTKMLDGIETTKSIYLMVDQSPVKAGSLHRRGGLHIDGNWIANDWQIPPSHKTLSFHGHRIEGIGTHKGHRQGFYTPDTLILASDVKGCRGFIGKTGQVPGEGGDCSHFDMTGLSECVYDAHHAYVGNSLTIHESLPLDVDANRTVVRLNLTN